MPTTSNRQASIDSRRIALEREITIRVPRFDTFVTEYSSNISTTGMFIVSDKPQAPGTTFNFEFSVADDWKLIRGKAQVVWTRYRDEGGERPAGMGVRFVELDAQSRRLIRWIVEKHIREGGKPFELDELRNVIDEALEEVVDNGETAGLAHPTSSPLTATKSRARPRAQRPVSAKSRSSDRNIVPLLATAAAVILAIVLLFWLTEWIPSVGDRGALAEVSDGSQPGAAVSTTPAQDIASAARETEPPSGEDPARSAASAQAAEGTRGVSGPPVGSAYNGVREALSEWSAAWSAQDVERYLAAYSREFRPEGSSRAAWAALRRERLTSPEFIKVSLTQLDIVRVRDDLIEASFFQSYRSERFSDSVRKRVEMIWEDGRWKIWREAAL